MNQEGWGFKEFLGFLTAIALAIFITMIIYNRNFSDLFDGSSSGGSYFDIEEDLEKIGHNYTDNYYYKALKNGDSDYVSVKELQDEGLISHVIDIEDDTLYCSGYIHFYKESNSAYYDAYIKCGDNYITDGYEAKYDEGI